MPVIRFGGNAGQSTNTTSQQVSAPATNKEKSVGLDNELQLDQKVRDLQQISQNIVIDSSKLKQTDKNLFLTNTTFRIEKVSATGNSLSVLQGTNYSVLAPTADTIRVEGFGKVLIFENIDFYSLGSSTPLLTIYSGSKVLFKNCVFRKDDNTQKAIDCFVSIQTDCNVSFVGCWFCGIQTTGNAINNAGNPNDVSINGGFNTTNRPHNNTTIFGEQT